MKTSKLMAAVLMLFLCFLNKHTKAQGLWGDKMVVGPQGVKLNFNGDTSLPGLSISFDSTTYCYNHNLSCVLSNSHSNICDSSTGDLLIVCNGMILWDTLGNVMPGGDSLGSDKLYAHNAAPDAGHPQASLILPKGNNQYYVFITTASDSMYDKWGDSSLGFKYKSPCDQLLYNVVDMNGNGGLGTVIKRKHPLLTNIELSSGQMTACKHSNNYDWWLIKQGDSNAIYRFLVTSDSIYGPYVQYMNGYNPGRRGYFSQAVFSPDGTKFVSVKSRDALYPVLEHPQILICDFDRGSGLMSKVQIGHLPRLNTGWSWYDSASWAVFYGGVGGVVSGVAMSPNNRYVYLTTPVDVLQYEYGESDSLKAWKNLFHYTLPQDHNYPYFSRFQQLYYGPDWRLYIGQTAGASRHMSYINRPNLKGDSSDIRWLGLLSPDTNIYSGHFTVLISPPNMPHFNLYKAQPDGLSDNNAESNLMVFPNPAQKELYIHVNEPQGETLALYDVNMKLQLLQQIRSKNETIQIGHLSSGLYFLRYGQHSQKLLINR